MNGELISWDEIVKRYPDKHVFVQNYIADGPNIRCGIVVEAVSSDEYDDALVRWYWSGQDYRHGFTGEPSRLLLPLWR